MAQQTGAGGYPLDANCVAPPEPPPDEDTSLGGGG